MAEPDNGLYYMRARYYDPEVGRFISEDPLGFDGGDLNLYAYVGNNPVMSVDPWGLCWSPAERAWNDAAYSIGQGVNTITDLALNGPAPARAILGFAAVTEIAPIATFGLVNTSAAALSVAYKYPELTILGGKAVEDIFGDGRPGVTKLVEKIWKGEPITTPSP